MEMLKDRTVICDVWL